MHRLCCILGVSACLGVSNTTAAEWYESVETEVRDPFRIGMFHSMPTQKKPDGRTTRIMGEMRVWGHPARGQMYAIFSKEKFDEIEKAGEWKYVRHEKHLNHEEKVFWRRFFEKRSEVQRVPFVVAAGGAIVGAANPYIGVGVGGGTALMDVLLGTDDVRTAEAAALAELMGEGGTFVDYLTIRRDTDGHPYCYSDVFYRVKVGEEDRSYLIYSSVHAVKVE